MKCKIMMAMMRLGPVRPPLPVRSRWYAGTKYCLDGINLTLGWQLGRLKLLGVGIANSILPHTGVVTDGNNYLGQCQWSSC